MTDLKKEILDVVERNRLEVIAWVNNGTPSRCPSLSEAILKWHNKRLADAVAEAFEKGLMS